MLTGIVITVALTAVTGPFSWTLQLLLGLLGLMTYGAIPPLQSRIIALAARYCPGGSDMATRLNIAAFNTGVVTESALGGTTLAHAGFGTLDEIGTLN